MYLVLSVSGAVVVTVMRVQSIEILIVKFLGQEHYRNVREATLRLSPMDPADLDSNHEPPAVSLMLLTTKQLDRLDEGLEGVSEGVS